MNPLIRAGIAGVTVAALLSMGCAAPVASHVEVASHIEECNDHYLDGVVHSMELAGADSAAIHFETAMGCADFYGLELDWRQKYTIAMNYWNLYNTEMALAVLDETLSLPDADIYKIQMKIGDIYEVEGNYELAFDAYLNAFFENETEEVRYKLDELNRMMGEDNGNGEASWGGLKTLHR